MISLIEKACLALEENLTRREKICITELDDGYIWAFKITEDCRNVPLEKICKSIDDPEVIDELYSICSQMKWDCDL